MKKLFLSIALLASVSYADDEAKLTHESEAGVIIASGNSDTQTYSVKQTTAYAWMGNTFRFTGSYLLGKTAGTDSARRWDLGLRYERQIWDNLSGFLGYAIDANPFSGTNLRHTVDVGGKYDFLKTDTTTIAAEAGYRMTAETFTADNGVTSNGELTSHMSRVYAEWKESWNKSLSSKLWVEYLQSFTNTADSRVNAEASIATILTDVFSIKLAYLLTYRGVPAVAGKKQTDTLFTTSLVAKF